MSQGLPYREFAKRQHRMLAAYMAMVAWRNRADCVHIFRDELLGYLGLEKLKAERESWIREDAGPWFPIVSSWCDPDRPGDYVESISFSRVALGELPVPQQPVRTEDTFLQEQPWWKAYKEQNELLPSYNSKLLEYMNPPPPSDFERLLCSDRVVGLPLPSGTLTEETVASILNRLSIGLDAETQLKTQSKKIG